VHQSNQQPASTTAREATAVADMFRELELLEEKTAEKLDERHDPKADRMRQ
jgi:hypothetical protein